MGGGIYVLKNDSELVTLPERQYDSEDLLQALLAKYPSLLAGDQIQPESPRRWLLVKREAEVPSGERETGRWSLDHLFVDQEGVPTLVEVKRSTDTRIRREVVGQMLDYAANAVVYWPIESLRHYFEQTCDAQKADPDEVLRDFLGPEADTATFWGTVKTNLQAGRIRLLFVADTISEELRRVVEFLNEQMDPAEVLAIEIKQYAGESLKTLVPRVVGQTAEAGRRKSGGPPSRQWDEESLLAELATSDGSEPERVARAIFQWADRNRFETTPGTGGIEGRLVRYFKHRGIEHQVLAVCCKIGEAKAWIEILFQYYARKPPFDALDSRREMLSRLNAIHGISLPDEAIDARPKIQLGALAKNETLGELLAVMDWYVAEVRNS